MKGKLLVITTIIIVIIIIFNVRVLPGNTKNNLPSPTPFSPYRASFGIVINKTFRNFSSPVYHNRSHQAYITAEEPAIVYIQEPNITWQQFFDTLPFTLSPACLVTESGQNFCTNETTGLRFFLNGTEHPQALHQIIQPADRLLVSYGNTSEAEVKEQIQRIPSIK